MKKFEVTIKRTIITIVEVDAISRAHARRLVKAYGEIEAVSDFKVIDENVYATVSEIEEVK